MAIAKTIDTKFSHNNIETKWRSMWEKNHTYKISDESEKERWYELTMYPYPSGDLHVGHWFAMTGADIHARYKRMNGYNVLHPMGFDAFGLNAENAAIQRGIHPHKWTMDNINRMKKQLDTLGPMYDWDRQVITCLPEYYKWNQWFFLQFLKNDLAYKGFAPVNWCPSCVTVLANEQVIDGICERCDTEVTHKDMDQWFLRITKYADELLDQESIDWPDRIKTMQTNWIGRSEGVEFEFDISHCNLEQTKLKTFTTRIDTAFGVTFVVMAPEHPLASSITSKSELESVQNYISKSRQSTEIERLATDREKTGVFTGSYCINQLTGEQIPIFIGDYVLASYGTGVVMGVPAHDQRDFEFAKKYGLEIRVVIAEENYDQTEISDAYIGAGVQINSGNFDGLSNMQGKIEIANHIEKEKFGNKKVNYKMRDWLISRQRYWGTPIPIIYCNDCGAVPVPEEDLPVILPEDAEFLPTGESPLALHEEFVNVKCPDCNKPSKRETDTMDTFVDSSWYFLRYTSPKFSESAFDPSMAKLWNPVDQYTGGVEHAVMHLLYSRFFVKAIRDLGLIDYDEPFDRLFNQGTIIYKGHKMSKSRGNVIAPDEYVEAVGADVVRTYLMFIGPWEQGGEWNDSGINGAVRWLNKVWDLVHSNTSLLPNEISEDLVNQNNRIKNQTIKKVTEDIDKFKYNTAIASLMEFTNQLIELNSSKKITSDQLRDTIETLLLLISPIAPHISEELWEYIGNEFSVHQSEWPRYDETLIDDPTVTFIVQVNGRVRDKITLASDISENEAKNVALESPKIKPHISGKSLNRVIFVPGKLINLVVS